MKQDGCQRQYLLSCMKVLSRDLTLQQEAKTPPAECRRAEWRTADWRRVWSSRSCGVLQTLERTADRRRVWSSRRCGVQRALGMEDEALATQHRVGSSLNQQNGSGDSGPPTPPPRHATPRRRTLCLSLVSITRRSKFGNLLTEAIWKRLLHCLYCSFLVIIWLLNKCVALVSSI